MNEIFVPLKDLQYQHLYDFTNSTPNICNNGMSAKSYCPSTISNSNDKSGNLNKRIKTDWINWNWDIPNDASLGDYRIKMMVFNEHNEEKPIKTIESKFTVRDPNASNYDHFNRVSI
jgi:hypothetical protein